MSKRQKQLPLGRPGDTYQESPSTIGRTLGCCAYLIFSLYIVGKFREEGFLFVTLISIIIALGLLLSRKDRAFKKVRGLIEGTQHNLLYDFDRMDGVSFENACASVLRANGYRNIRMTKASGDYGADILCDDGSYTYAVQCKRYSKNVGVKALQEVESGCHYYGRGRSIVMTNSYFTSAAIELAERNSIRLIDRNQLYKMCNTEGRGKTVAEVREIAHAYEALFRIAFHLRIKIPRFSTHLSKFHINYELKGKAEKLGKHLQRMADEIGVCHELVIEDDGWHLILTLE